MLEQLVALSDNPLWIALAIILVSYLLEDLAIVGAAVLAADGAVSPELALASVFVGIASGDLGLYGLGAVARRSRGLRYRLLGHKQMRRVRALLLDKPFQNVFFVRFLPGLRFLGYTLSGFYRLGLPVFMAAVMLATGLWTVLVFVLVYQLGVGAESIHASLKWWLVPIVLGGLLFGNRHFSTKLAKRRAV